MDSDSDRSAFTSRHIGLAFDSASSLVPPTFYTSHHLLTRDEIYRSLAPHKSHLIPVEIFTEIFLYTVQADPRSQANLMLVCQHWRDIMLSTPGIHSQLRINRWTRKKDVERFGKRWLLDVTIGQQVPDLEKGHRDPWYPYDTVGFHACFMAAAGAASRWRSLALLSFPPPGECEDLQIMHPLEHLESFKLATCCDLGSFLEPLLNAITTTVTPRFTLMEVLHPDAALYLLQPAHIQIFSSLTVLRLICRRMQDPTDILPSLHKLEIFEAHHLFLPISLSGVDLPLVHTLRVLHLKSVSIQWMAGRVFHALEECSIIFPRHVDAIQSVYMPSCSTLKYDSNNLGVLEHFHISRPDKLEIKCGQWKTWRGTLQLVALHPIFATQSLTCLHLEIKCSERLLAYMLRLAPALEELWMRLSSPHSLSNAFFLAFAAGGRKTNAGQSNETVAPLGRKLRALHLHYKRWLRGPERNLLIPVFGAIVASHPPEQILSFRFRITEGSESQEWIIHEPVERFNFGGLDSTAIGVSSPDGIVPLLRSNVDDDDTLTKSKYLPLPRESEYIRTDIVLHRPIDFLFSFHSLKEVRMTRLILDKGSGTRFSLGAPLFHTLKVLIVRSIPSSFFAGKTFHKLERFKEECIENFGFDHWPISEPSRLTEMPVCKRLVVRISTLVTLKLPQIRELCVHNIDEVDRIWVKHIAVNANLSELNLLHVLNLREPPSIAFIKILGLLPAVRSLIIGVGSHCSSFVDCLEAFVPKNVPGPSEPNQSSWEGQISGILCPRLKTLKIEGISLTERVELMLVLKNIITLRAAIGSPLKSFTFYFHGSRETPQMWQLIGRDKSFMMEEVVPAKKFRLNI